MTDLGNLNKTLALQCKPCGWRPPQDAVTEAVQLHFQVEHDTDEVTLDLVPVCTCGTAMTSARSAPAGGGFKDYMECKACGHTGFLRRNT